ncbi:hypothetical protein GCM10009687_81040 [Asanoa iriomotensis]
MSNFAHGPVRDVAALEQTEFLGEELRRPVVGNRQRATAGHHITPFRAWRRLDDEKPRGGQRVRAATVDTSLDGLRRRVAGIDRGCASHL